MGKLTARFNKYTACLMKAIKKMCDPAWWLQHRYIRYYDTLPIEPHTILLESQHGKQFEGIIFRIAQQLASDEAYRAFTLYLSVIPSQITRVRAKLARYGLTRINLCPFKSDRYYRVLASAHYLVNDNTFMPFFIKKPGQVYLNTWHGTPLKTLGKQVVGQAHFIGNVQRNFLAADYLLCPNAHTDRVLRQDYMLDNLAKGKRLFGGYPRNAIFFHCNVHAPGVKAALALEGKRVYAYLPTYRGSFITGKTSQSDIYLLYHLYELDKRLTDDECLLVNLHPVTRSSLSFNAFKHIKPFPDDCETYEVLTAADVLITDYSSVFFDFACSQKKIVLFTYDKDEYLRDRGLYFPMDTLPFPQVETIAALLEACRSPKTYDDAAFLETFCPYDHADATKSLCRHVFLGEKTLEEAPFPNNGKENVLLYSGNLAPNGITTALFNLLNSLDRSRRNYIILADYVKVAAYASQLTALPEGVTYLMHHGDFNLTFVERLLRGFFKLGLLKTPCFLRHFKRRFQQELLRTCGTSTIHTALHFSGYENEMILWFAQFPCKRLIYVHSNMCDEIRKRGNQREDVLRYAYAAYDDVIAVTRDLIEPTRTFMPAEKPVQIVRNFIDDQTVLRKSLADPVFDPETESTHTLEQIQEILNDASRKKFVSVGRFSPEKGHLRLIDAFARLVEHTPSAMLFIIGGNVYQGYYQKLIAHIQARGLQQNVVLILRVSNPFPFVKACDGFVLSSFYEGFGLVLAEADILGLPVISTDIVGPRLFMQAYGGTLVENSEAGLYQGMTRLLKGEIRPMHVDYAAYNRENRRAFEELLAASATA